MLASSVRITVAALARMLRQHRLTVPPVLDTTPVFTDAAESRALDAAMWQEFGELGLVARGGGLTPGALDTLSVLGRANVEYFGWFHVCCRDYSLVVAELGEDAVVAVRGSHSVRITPVGDAALPETLIRYLPQTRPARIDAVNVRRDAAGDDSVVRQLAAQEPTGLGELYVAVRDRLARRRTTTEPVRYRDTAQGRVLVRLTEDYLSLAPANDQLLAGRLREAHQELAG